MMDQKLRIIFLLIWITLGFLYIRYKKSDFRIEAKLLMVIGVGFMTIGVLIVSSFHDFQTLIDILVFKSTEASGRLIYIGYGFLYLSYLDEVINGIRKR